MDNDTLELGAATVDQLVAALAKRCPAIIIAACVPDDGEKCDTKMFDHGNLMTLRGMALTILEDVERRIRKRKMHFKG